MKDRFNKGVPLIARSGMVAASGMFYKMLMTMPPEPAKPKPQGDGKTRPIKIPDETILKLRHRHEVDRIPLNELCKEFPDLQKLYIRRILNYELRANLTLPKK